MSTEINSIDTKENIEVDAEKRAFMKKFGKYAAVSAGMATLMTPTKSSACNYTGGGCGCGTGGTSSSFSAWLSSLFN